MSCLSDRPRAPDRMRLTRVGQGREGTSRSSGLPPSDKGFRPYRPRTQRPFLSWSGKAFVISGNFTRQTKVWDASDGPTTKPPSKSSPCKFLCLGALKGLPRTSLHQSVYESSSTKSSHETTSTPTPPTCRNRERTSPLDTGPNDHPHNVSHSPSVTHIP